VTVPEERGTERSCQLEVGKARTGSRRVKVILNDSGITIAETRGACLFAVVLLSPYSGQAKSGPWSKMGLRNGYDKLADRVPYGRLGPTRPCKLRFRQLGFVSCLIRVS
jgi:hypothetical protein